MSVEFNRASSWRLALLFLVVVVAMTTLVARLWKLEVTDSDLAQQKLRANTTIRSRLPAPRGSICDRAGIPLAQNRLTFGIDLYLDDLYRSYKQAHQDKYPVYAYPSGRLKQAANDDPSINITPQYLSRLPKKLESNWVYEPDIVQMVRETLTPILLELQIDHTLSDKEVKDIREHYQQDRDLPYHLLTDLDFSTVAQFNELNLGVNGIRFAEVPVRQYTYGAFAAHIMGYVGKPDQQAVTRYVKDPSLIPPDVVGRQGIESFFEDDLQGKAGIQTQQVSSQGYVMEDQDHPEQTQEPSMGDTVYLTLDAHLQYIVETSLRSSHVARGAVVMMDPNNGDILAMASVPNFDPNSFIPKIDFKTWKELNEDPTAPLYNRALHGLPPGSTYKIMVALAGLRSGKVSRDEEFNCPGALQIADHLFHNDVNVDSRISVREAIETSNNTFFCQWGIACGISAIDAMGQRVGFGHAWKVFGDDEDPGILPNPDWFKKKRKLNWSTAQTANVSIGQGDVLCTPLQMATFLCSVANGGTVYAPRLFSRVTDSDGNWKDDPRIKPPTVYNSLDCKPEDLHTVQLGLLDVVEEGTGTKAQVDGIHVGGKTGTAQAFIKVNGERRKDLKTWFYCYAPFDKPRYVVCVLVEGGSWGGVTAAPIAQQILTRAFALEKGSNEKISYLNPVVGNFDTAPDVDSPTAIDNKPTPKPTTKPTATLPVAVSIPLNSAGPVNPMGEPDTDSNAPPEILGSAAARSTPSQESSKRPVR